MKESLQYIKYKKNYAKISLLELVSIIVFFSCVEIPSVIKVTHGQRYLFYIRVIIIVYLFVRMAIKRIRFGRFKLIFIWCLLTILPAFFSGHDMLYAMRIISSPFLMALFLKCNENKFVNVLAIWKNILATLVFVDFVTIAIFPNGMYSDGLQTLNWFLGYKTARFALALPLCVISGYLSKIKKGKYGVFTYLLILVSAFCMYRAQATAALVSTLLLGVLYVFLDLENIVKGGYALFYKLFNYKTIILGCALLNFLFISIDSIPVLQNFVVAVLHKNANLTTRTFIWGDIIPKILERPILGHGILDQETYIQITHNVYANSPHNMLLEMLVSCGVVGLAIYILILIQSMKKESRIYQVYELPIVAGIIIMLIVGITSSSLVFSEFALIYYVIMDFEQQSQRGIVNE